MSKPWNSRTVFSPWPSRDGCRAPSRITYRSELAHRIWLTVAAVALAASTASEAQGQTWEWAVSPGASSGYESGQAIAVDAVGNTYTAVSKSDRVSIRGLSPEGTNLPFQKNFSGPGDSSPTGIAVDAAGNVYVTGRFTGDISIDTEVLTNSGGYDGFVVKFDNSGVVSWAKALGGVSYDSVGGVAVDGLGNCFVTGSYSSTVSFDSVILTSAGSDDIFVIKFNGSGVEQWVKSAGGTGFDKGSGIAADAIGNCYLTGYFSSAADFDAVSLFSAGAEDLFVAKYSPAGAVVWAKRSGGPTNDLGVGIAVDGSGGVYVTGEYNGTSMFGSVELTSSGMLDVVTAKFDGNDGDVLWAKSGGGSAANDLSYGIATDGSGDVYVTGEFRDLAVFGTLGLSSAGDADLFVISYDSTGVEAWAESAGWTSLDIGNGIAVDATANIYLTGEFRVAGQFGPLSVPNHGNADAFVAKIAVPTPPICGDNAVNQPSEECDGTDDGACPGTCLASCVCPTAGTCMPDTDGDGIQDILDEDDANSSNFWSDNSTTPVNFGGNVVRLGAEVTVCDLADPDGVKITNLTGPTAVARSFCPTESMQVRNLEVLESTQFDCLSAIRSLRSNPIARATAVTGDVTVDLISQGQVIASLMLPEGNAVQYIQDTLEVITPQSNNVILTIQNGPTIIELPPGTATTVVDYVTVPALSAWGLGALALAMSCMIAWVFHRHRREHAAKSA